MKSTRTNRLALIALILIGHGVALMVGFILARDVITKSYEEVDNFNTFARYEIARDIARSMKSGNHELAKCQADLEASSGFDYVKRCMDDKQCAAYISKDVHARTPEIVSGASLGFDYIQRKGDTRSCGNK